MSSTTQLNGIALLKSATPAPREIFLGLARERSRALHVAIAQKIVADESVLKDGRARVDAWLRDGRPARAFAESCFDLLGKPLNEIVEKLAEPSEKMHELRQVSPLAGALDARTRWRIHRDVSATFLDEAQRT